MSTSRRSRLYASVTLGGVLVALGICDFVLSDRQVRPWVVLGVGGWTLGSSLRQLGRETNGAAPDPTLRQGFWMFAGFFLLGIITIAVATTEEGLALAFWLVLGIFIAAYGAIGLSAVAWTFRTERKG